MTSQLETNRLYEFTPREIEVWGYVSKGYANPHIAQLMNVSCKSIERHVCAIYNKTQHVRHPMYQPRVWMALQYREAICPSEER